MPWRDWYGIRSVGVDVERNEERERYALAAFTAFQQGAGEDKQTFGEFLNKIGLGDDTEQAASPKLDKEQAKRNAEQILQAELKKRGQLSG